MVLSRPNKCNLRTKRKQRKGRLFRGASFFAALVLFSSLLFSYRRLPRQKCSIMWNISTGFSIEPYSGSSDMIRSISTFAWMKSPSVDRRTVPLMPIKQCSFVLWRTALLSRFLLCPGLLILVRIQQMSSHRLKPHLRRQKRPISNPSLLPHHRNTKLRLAATSPISNSIIYQVVFNTRVAKQPTPLWSALRVPPNNSSLRYSPDPNSIAERSWHRRSVDIPPTEALSI